MTLYFCQALEFVVGVAGKSASSPVLANVVMTLQEQMNSFDDEV
jgi:hypothetical protein